MNPKTKATLRGTHCIENRKYIGFNELYSKSATAGIGWDGVKPVECRLKIVKLLFAETCFPNSRLQNVN